jgi:hypothetical protein
LSLPGCAFDVRGRRIQCCQEFQEHGVDLSLFRRCQRIQGFGVGGVHGGVGLCRETQAGLGGVQALGASVAGGGAAFQQSACDQSVDGGAHGLGGDGRSACGGGADDARGEGGLCQRAVLGEGEVEGAQGPLDPGRQDLADLPRDVPGGPVEMVRVHVAGPSL